MKKILKSASFLVFAVCLPQACFAGQAAAAYQNAQGASLQEDPALPGAQESPEAQTQKLSKELARNRELLDIWKDHVRTITKERDDAYKQIDDLKAGQAAPVASVFSESEKEQYEQTIEDLKAQVSGLTADLNAAKPQTADESSRLKLADLRAENDKLKLSIKSLSEAQNDQEIIIREKQRALERIDELEKQVSALRAAAAAAPAPLEEKKVEAMQAAYDDLEINFKEQQDKVRKLQAEKLEDKTKIQELKTQLLKIQSGNEDQTSAQSLELQEARSTIEELRGEISKLRAEKEEIRKDYNTLDASGRTQGERLKGLSAEVDALKTQAAALQNLRNDYQAQTQQFKALSEEKESLNGQIRLLNAQVDALKANSQEISAVKQQLSTALAEKEALEKDNLGLETGNQNLNSKIQSLKSDMDQLRAENQKAESLKAELAKTLADKETLQKAAAVLQANFTAQDQKFKEYSTKLGELDRANNQLKAENKRISQANQSLQASLQGNLSDIKNLRANFESYLESLEQSFGERQKDETQTASS